MLSRTSIVGTSTRLRFGTLLATLALLLLGVAYAQERDGERSDVDCRALGMSLKAAVANGELTGEQARERYEAACGERREDSLEGHFGRLGIERRGFEKIKRVLAESGLTEEHIEPTLGGMLRVVREMKSEGDDYEMDPSLLGYFENELGLTDGQIDLVQGIARRVVHASSLEGHYEKMGVGPAMLGEMRSAFANNGITQEQMEPTLGGTLRVIHEMKSEGEDYDMNARLLGYLQSEVGLTDEQIEQVEEIAGGILQALSERGNDAKWDAIKRRIEGAVERGELTREEADAKYAAIKRGMYQDTRVDWDAITRRIEGAVERGELTRAQADAKYAEIKKGLDHEDE